MANYRLAKAIEYTTRCKSNATRLARIASVYGLSPDEYLALVLAQDARCAICGSKPGNGKHLCVDHDHATGNVRGLLCTRCNTGIGQFKDNPLTLREAAAYIERTM